VLTTTPDPVDDSAGSADPDDPVVVVTCVDGEDSAAPVDSVAPEVESDPDELVDEASQLRQRDTEG
jgi:hypothetical protein